jgi:hypothetical protein
VHLFRVGPGRFRVGICKTTSNNHDLVGGTFSKTDSGILVAPFRLNDPSLKNDYKIVIRGVVNMKHRPHQLSNAVCSLK